MLLGWKRPPFCEPNAPGQFGLDYGAIGAVGQAHVQLDVERYADGVAQPDIVSHQPILFHVCEEVGPELLRDLSATQPVDADNDRVPARHPPERRVGVLHAGELERPVHVVLQRDPRAAAA